MPDPATGDEEPAAGAERPVLPYRPELPVGGPEPLTRGRRLLVVLFFVPPLLLLVLLVVWTLSKQ